jgi:transcriptional regulator with XRE-family HTH domain
MRGIGRRLKRLREARGFTQEALAEKVGTSRVTIARIETRNRRPSIPMLQKLARALGVEVEDMLADTLKAGAERAIPTTERVTRVEFRVKRLFPLDKKMSVPLLRLMAATNDSRHLLRLMMMAHDVDVSNEAERLNADGEVKYLFRMLCGHLHEAGLAFRSLDASLRDDLDAQLAKAPEGLAALQTLRRVYGDQDPTGFRLKVLGPIRTLGAFHYKDKVFEDSLVALADRPQTLIVSPHALGLSRYCVTDAVASRLIGELAGGTQEAFERVLQESVSLASALGLLVDHLLVKLLAADPSAIQARYQHGIRIPEALVRMREQVARAAGEVN